MRKYHSSIYACYEKDGIHYEALLYSDGDKEETRAGVVGHASAAPPSLRQARHN